MSLMRLHGTKLPVRNEPFEMYEDISNVKPASITELTDFILERLRLGDQHGRLTVEDHHQCRAAARHQGGCLGDQVARDALCGQSVI